MQQVRLHFLLLLDDVGRGHGLVRYLEQVEFLKHDVLERL
jgi:hypothetical protein